MTLYVKQKLAYLASLVLLAVVFGCAAQEKTGAVPANAGEIQLRIIETTDIHTNIMDYNYFRDVPSKQIGLVRTATLVKQAQAEAINSVLVDNGDLIQGSPMGDYMAAKGVQPGEVHPVYKAMNQLNYQVGNIGNHEFNYGLEFLQNTIAGADFPYISANVFDEETSEPYFDQYLIKDYTFTDTKGQKQAITIGYIGFVPPQIMVWDKQNLDGKVFTKDMKVVAEKLVPQMKAEGADLVIAIPHSGISIDPYKNGAENATYYLSEVKGIDAIAFGHTHAVFPSENFSSLQNIDAKKGTINGIPSVMPGRWGSHVGIIDLTLKAVDGKWQVVDGHSEARPIYDTTTKKPLVKADTSMVKAVEQEHNETRAFVNQNIGQANDVMYSYLALVQDDPTVQIVNMAQKAYVENFIQGDPDLDDLPVLSAAAPFKAGGRKNDPNGYTEVESGTLSFRNAADLYLYPNTLVALKVSGKEVRDWLECSAGQFNQIDPNSAEPQNLINWDDFRTYNFDVIDGVNYQVDVTQPAEFDGDCKVVNADASRIVNLTFNGKPVDDEQMFIMATNNYRAFSGKFPGTGADHVAFESPDENRSVLSSYISQVSERDGEVTPSADNNWSFVKIDSDKELDIRFETSASEKATQFVTDKGQYPMKRLATDEVGFAVYRINLQ